MSIEIEYKEEPFFHIVINDAFSKNDLLIIKEEIKTLKSLSDIDTSPATDHLGNSFKKGRGIFLAEYEKYENLKIISKIDNIIRKINNIKIWKNKTLYRFYNSVSWGSELLNCYNNEEYYLPHSDDGVFTLISFFYDSFEEKKGGDLYFPEYDYLHVCKHNQSILFLSKELHGVTPYMTEGESNRYSMVTFSELEENTKNNHRKIKNLNYD